MAWRTTWGSGAEVPVVSEGLIFPVGDPMSEHGEGLRQTGFLPASPRRVPAPPGTVSTVASVRLAISWATGWNMAMALGHGQTRQGPWKPWWGAGSGLPGRPGVEPTRASDLDSGQRVSIILARYQRHFLIDPGLLLFHVGHELLILQGLFQPLAPRHAGRESRWLDLGFQPRCPRFR